MSAGQILQLVGTIALVVFGFGLVDVAHSTERFSRYGREALYCAAAFSFAACFARMAALLGLFTQENARIVNGLLAVAFVAILAQIVWLHRVENGNAPRRE